MASAAVTFRERSELGPRRLPYCFRQQNPTDLGQGMGVRGRGPAPEVLFPAFAVLNEDFILV